MGAPAARRVRVHRRRRPRRAAGVPALEPGSGAAPGADHDRDLGDRRRPDHRPLPARSGASAVGGNAVDRLAGLDRPLIDLQLAGVEYSLARLVMLALGVAVGLGLWLWLYSTKTGMVIRAGVDDRQMTSALGINIQVDVRDRVRRRRPRSRRSARSSARSQGNVAPGQDGQWLLYSLVVVIIGGMGSLARRRRRARCSYGLVFTFAAVVPADDRRRLLHAVLDRRSRSSSSPSSSPSGRRGSSGEPA